MKINCIHLNLQNQIPVIDLDTYELKKEITEAKEKRLVN